VSAFAVGALCGGLMGGWLADHFGRRNTIVLGTFLSASSFMLLYTASTLPTIIACTFLAGLTSGIYQPAIGALLADIVPPAQRVRAYASIRAAANAGFACGAATGGVLANYSFFWLFAGDALTTAIYGCIALLWLPHGLRAAREKTARWGESLKHIAGDRPFQALWVSAFLASLVYAQFASTYSLHVIRNGLNFDAFGFHIGPETVYGLLVGWNGAFVMLGELPLTAATMRFDPRRVMAVGYILVGAGFAMNALAHSIFALWIAMTIFTIGEMISAPTTSAQVARFAPERMRGRYMGALGLSWNGAGILGPQIGFRLLARDPNLVWLVCGVLGFAAAFTIWRFGRPRETPAPALDLAVE
jgi:MFS family permease